MSNNLNEAIRALTKDMPKEVLTEVATSMYRNCLTRGLSQARCTVEPMCSDTRTVLVAENVAVLELCFESMVFAVACHNGTHEHRMAKLQEGLDIYKNNIQNMMDQAGDMLMRKAEAIIHKQEEQEKKNG